MAYGLRVRNACCHVSAQLLPIVGMHERHICGRKTLTFGYRHERMPTRISVHQVAIGTHDPNGSATTRANL